MMMLLKNKAGLAFGLFMICAASSAGAQTPAAQNTEVRNPPAPAAQGQVQRQPQAPTQQAQAQTAPAEKEVWKAPFGGSFTATFAFATDYSYRGISQTQRQIAVQPSFTYETPTVSEKVQLSAYVGAWG